MHTLIMKVLILSFITILQSVQSERINRILRIGDFQGPSGVGKRFADSIHFRV